MLIEEYFLRIEAAIGACPYIVESEIRKEKRSFYIGIIEGRIRFSDDSTLHFIEFMNVKENVNKYKYSYHYQDKMRNLIFRYDVAPHHMEIKTFPHHKHLYSKEVIEASEPTLKEVLQEIVDFLISSSQEDL